MSENKKVLLIEPCNFADYPEGGQLAMALRLTKAFPDRLALVGLTTDDTPARRWVRRDLEGKSFWFFAAGRRRASSAQPLIPARLRWYLDLQRCRRAILEFGAAAALAQAPETLLAVSSWGWKRLCYYSPGANNPLPTSRYKGAAVLAGLYDRYLFKALESTDVVLVAADAQGIEGMIARSRGVLERDKVVFCPTCVDTAMFHPRPAGDARGEVGLRGRGPVVVTCGRITECKGWPLLIEAFRLFGNRRPGAELLFVGDGEDRPKLEARVRELGLSERIRVTGNQSPERVCSYMNAADLVVVASMGEGWSVAMLEALACGRTLVSTNVSGASAMIREGENGFILRDRNPETFAAAMDRALALRDARRISVSLASCYSLDAFRRSIASVWEPLASIEQPQARRMSIP